jgi:hypothetical protein
MTIWLTVKEFAERQKKRPVTVYRWASDGFLLSLGFSLTRDFTGHLRIGIPPEHPSYVDFR